MNKQIKKIGKYRLIKKIGKGSTSEVYESVREGSNEKFAIKVIPLLGLDENQRLMIKREVDIIRNIRHANIVHLYDTIETKNNNYLVFQLCENGDLQKYLAQCYGSKVPEKVIQRIIYCLSDVIVLIHSKGITHRDIKLSNVLIDNNYQIKLADFGFAKKLDQNIYTETYCGTPMIMAPEILLSRPYNKKCDVWSIGVLIYQMTFGRLPFCHKNGIHKFFKNVVECQIQIPNKSDIKEELKLLLKQTLQRNPSKRIDINDLIKNKWVREGAQFVELRTEKLIKKKQNEQVLQNWKKLQITQNSESFQLQLLLAKRLNKQISSQLNKIIMVHLQARQILLNQLEHEIKLKRLTLNIDKKLVQYLGNMEIVITNENNFQKLKANQLSGVHFPKPLSLDQYDIGTTGPVILEYLKSQSQKSMCEKQRRKVYQNVIKIMQFFKCFELKVTILFSNRLYEEIELEKVIQKIQNKNLCHKVDSQIQTEKGNCITLLMECSDKDEKVKSLKEKLIRNCQRRIRQIESEL